MKYYSTNHKAPEVALQEAVTRGLAPDKGLYVPKSIPQLPKEFYDAIDSLSFQEIAFEAARALFGEDIPSDDLKRLVYSTLEFDCPVVKVADNIYALELFHGPTLAFKDVGARFMARLLQYFLQKERNNQIINVLVATSGDTGSAVANGFLNVEGIRVFVLYPKGKVSPIQESQFATLGANIAALEVDGTFDDCQALVKTAFTDSDLNARMRLTSANSINVARFLPQAFYYFYAYAQLLRLSRSENPQLADNPVICVPSGNFGNLCAGLYARQMGLPIKRFIAANNANDVFYSYLQTGRYCPRPSVQTIANAMDVGAPSNFARILELFNGSHDDISKAVSGAAFTDSEIAQTILNTYTLDHYLCDPHGACALRALRQGLRQGETGLFLETAHPAKFGSVIASIIGHEPPTPARLKAFMQGKKQSVPLKNSYAAFKSLLLKN